MGCDDLLDSETSWLQLTTVVEHEVAQLTVRGEVDLSNADELKTAGVHALSSWGVVTLLVDMACVTFICAAGVGALVSIRNISRQHGQVVSVVEPARCVRRILELTALTDVFGPCS
jgi:anti-sigma B factor antagonist